MNVLHYAISQGNEALVLRLLEMKPDLIYKPSRNGFTPLSMAMGLSCSFSYSFVMRLFALCHPQAVATVTDIDKARLLREAVRARDDDNDEFGLDLLLPISTLDQVQAAFAKARKTPCTARLRALVEVQCGPLSLVLNQDVMGIVNEYLFGGGSKPVGESEADESGARKERRRREDRWFEAAVRDMAQLLEEDPTLIDVVDGGGDESAGFGGSGSTALHMASYAGCECRGTPSSCEALSGCCEGCRWLHCPSPRHLA